jgi:hypothetical protein
VKSTEELALVNTPFPGEAEAMYIMNDEDGATVDRHHSHLVTIVQVTNMVDRELAEA